MTTLHLYIKKTELLTLTTRLRIDCLKAQNNLTWFDRCFAHFLYSARSQGFLKLSLVYLLAYGCHWSYVSLFNGVMQDSGILVRTLVGLEKKNV